MVLKNVASCEERDLITLDCDVCDFNCIVFAPILDESIIDRIIVEVAVSLSKAGIETNESKRCG